MAKLNDRGRVSLGAKVTGSHPRSQCVVWAPGAATSLKILLKMQNIGLYLKLPSSKISI